MKAAPRLDSRRASSVACPVVPSPAPAFEDPTPRRPHLRLLALFLLASLAACGSWSRVGSPDQPEATAPERLPQIFEPTAAFREMGLIAEGGPMPVYGTVRVLAGPTPDSLLALVALSLRNRGLTFRREGDVFLGEYRVEIALRQGVRVAAQAARDEAVRVVTFRETQRNDESIIFQHFLPVAPGPYELALTVRDRRGPGNTRVELPVTVPSIAGATVALPIAVYRARPRTDLAATPELVVNPRSAVEYGTDTLLFFLETYGLAAGRTITASATDIGGRVAWTDSIRVDSTARVRGWVFAIPPHHLSIGRYEFRVSLGAEVDAATPFLVTFSDLYAVANLDEIVSLLRYFPGADSLRAILNSAPAERGAAWQRFWRRTDPNPATPENEALDEYLARVQAANTRFREEGIPGWLTERGWVFICLGEPDEFLDRRTDSQIRSRYIQWTYYQHRLSLTFVDDGGFGRYRLEPRSRSEFLRVLNRVRQQ